LVSQQNGLVIHTIAPGSWMEYALNKRPLIYNGGYVPPYVPVSTSQGEKASLKVSFDLGNGKGKISLISQRDYILRAAQVPTTFRWAQNLTTGSYATTYRLLSDTKLPLTPREQEATEHGGTPFSSDPYIVGEGGDALPMGESEVRLANRQYRLYIWAAIANAMEKSGYQQGEYNIVMALGLRNEEMEISDEGESRMKKAIQEVAQTYYGTTVEVEITTNTTAKGKGKAKKEVKVYKFTVTDIVPYAQTLGSFELWYNGLDGRPAQTKIKRAFFIDLGAGDGHVLEVDCTDPDNPRTIGMRAFAGTIYLGEQLATLIQKEHKAARGKRMNPADLQQTLITGKILISGIEYEVPDLVAQAVQLSGPTWINNILGNTLIDRDGFYFFGGGGVLLQGVEAMLANKMAALEKEVGLNYYINDRRITVESNSFGGNTMLDAIFRTVEDDEES
jgi:hypothetical protein